jgi:hypothetical protein
MTNTLSAAVATSARTDAATESDHAILSEVADTLTTPRDQPANSFVLHAPLEVAARSALMRFVDDAHRHDARERLREVARQWAASGNPVAPPSALPAESEAAGTFAAALDAGDPDAADASATMLARFAQPGDLAALIGDAILTRTTAAAHAPIFLYLLPRVAPRGELPVALLRPLARELARVPDWRIRWVDEFVPATTTASGLFAAIAATPRVGAGDSQFVHPTLMQVDPSGVAAGQLAGTVPSRDHRAAAHAILRAAALSMLLEPDDHAPYGWSHCLTMPQAVLGISDRLADPARAIAVAATYAVAFRATLGVRPLDEDGYAPERPALAWRESFAAGSSAAAAAVWHADAADDPLILIELASRAAVHGDAHLVKYTLACLDAAAFDTERRRLYLAAAAHLHGVWATTATPWRD